MPIHVNGTDFGYFGVNGNIIELRILSSTVGEALSGQPNNYESSTSFPGYDFLLTSVIYDDESFLATNDGLFFNYGSQYGVIATSVLQTGVNFASDDDYFVRGLFMSGAGGRVNAFYDSGHFTDGFVGGQYSGLIDRTGPAGDNYWVPIPHGGSPFYSIQWVGLSWGLTEFLSAAAALRAGNAAPLAAILNSDTYVFDGGSIGESFTGYALNDTLYGNGGNDTLDGAGGNDQIFGGDGADSLLGGAGLDSIYGGAENDTVRGGSEADYVLAGDGSDTVWGDEGNDLIYGGLGVDALIGGTGSDTLYGDEGEDELQGDWGGDALYGGDGADRLYGDLALDGAPFGNDTLDGGLGRDTLWGGGGDDLYVIGDLTQSGNLLLYDVIVELPNAGIDTVYLAPGALGTYTLPDNVENLAILGTAAMNAIGNGLDNQLTGNGFANALTGGAGFDTLDGGQAYDTLVGGTGNDVYVLADTNSVAGLISLAYDQVVENAGGGFDTIRIARAPQSIQDRPPPLSPIITYWTSFTLPAEIEAGEVIGTDAFDLTGNEVANRLTGNGAANALLGMAGSDSVFGMGGDDVLNGGEGADTLDGGEGVDWASYAFDTQVVAANLFGGLAVQNAGQPGATVDSLAFIENIFGGNAGDFLIGNDVANRLEGGFGGDNLWGYGGADTLLGGDGDDIVVGGDANDSLESGLGQDWLYGQGGNDTLRGTDATANAFNVLVGGDGDDMLIAGPTGFDYLYGGDGANRNGDDLFVMAPNSGVKVLVDFEAGGANDEVRLAGTALTSFAQVQANLSFSGTINGMVLVVDAGTQVWFLGATPGQLTAGDFLFA